MRYLWASFCHKNPIPGRIVHILVILIALASIVVPLMTKDATTILISLCVALVCFVLFVFFALADKMRSIAGTGKDTCDAFPAERFIQIAPVVADAV